MTTAEMIEKAKQMKESVSSYHYNPKVLADVIIAGYDAIPDGSVFMSKNGLVLKKVGDEVVSELNGEEKRREPVGNRKDSVLMAYAMDMSQLSTNVG